MVGPDEPMRIAINCHPTQGGSGVVGTELAMALADRGHEVHMVSFKRPFRLPDDSPVKFHRVNVVDYPLFKFPPHDLCLANELAEVTMDYDIQIIHAHYAVPHAVSAILANQIIRDHPVKVVTTVHGTDITLVGSQRDFYRICRYAMVEADALTAVSQWLADETVREFKLEDDVHVIPNFVDTDRFCACGRAGYPEDGKFTIMHASNFRPVKRVYDVVRVFAEIRKKLDAKLLMVGEGPEVGSAKCLVSELGLCGDVEFLGASRDVGDVFRQSHLNLLLSEYESFGLTALEAMASGTPTIVSKAGGLVEVVDDGVTGRLCPVGHIEEMAAAGVEILENKERWEAYSEAGKRHTRSVFARDLIIPQYEALYRKVLNGQA